jgi:hypothetical protein
MSGPPDLEAFCETCVRMDEDTLREVQESFARARVA